MEIIILAGGLGTRLRSVVKEVPKCMAPVCGRPFLWYILKYLTRFYVNKVILSVGYLRNIIIDWVETTKDEFPFDFDFAIEDIPLGTGGGIKLALSKATTSDVIVLNGDTFFEVNLNELMDFHRLYPSVVTLALKPMYDFDRYGRVIIDQIDKRIVEFQEKRFCQEGLINGGVYIINKLEPIFEGLPEKFSFETEVLEPICKLGKSYGFIQDSKFIDIGIPSDYKLAQEIFKENNENEES